jgi:hypothetical protein
MYSRSLLLVWPLSQVNEKYLIRSHRVNSFVSPVPTRTFVLPRHAGIHGDGQAAGVCAALAASLGKPPWAIPVSAVQIELTRQSANLRGTSIKRNSCAL